MRLWRKCWQISGFYGQPKRDRGQPDQVKAVMETPHPRSKKELQRLTGKLVASGRIIARFTDELRPFFLAIRKAGASGWTDSCQNAFEKIKHCLMQPPILSNPIPKEKLYMYLAVSEWAVSVVLFRCPSPKEQRPIYYVSRALADVETRYSKMELTALALRSAAQKLRPYFQAHSVVVLTDQPLRNILHKPDLTGRMLQWAIELSEFGIEFQPRLSMKGQVMADFVLEYARRPNQHQESNEKEWWTLLVDGASRSSGSGVGLLLQSPTGEHLEKPLLATPLRQTKQTAKNGRTALQNTSGQTHKVRVQAARFTIIGGHLYKRSFTGPYLRCLSHSETQYLLAELHEGICGNHSRGRSLAHRAHSQGYYWPTMKKDAQHMLKNVTNVKGPLPAAPAQKKFLLVATNYFSKWVEAEAYASIKDKDVTKFVWKNIVCRFKIPHTIIADNGPQFDSIAFRNFYSELNIRNSYSTPRYPQRKWVEELPGVLWAYQTTPGRPTGNTPFALAYGMDAVIPTEIGLPTIRTEAAKQDDASEELRRNLDWADEVRESAAIRMADYQQRASAHYNRKVRPRSFKNGTLVLGKVFENTTEMDAGKFQANWKGPYIISKSSQNGAYHLQKLNETPLLRPWNVSNLKQYYQ
ncbi:Retrovirus-related Pol polyprotein from transposon 17.6 [Vitis vinifera]|uniref:Retrovirus-related Pol polyprotein from transposon 17.6 n=1 Tax=Vitis vinifera TaxID=29760 RepID=A0A438H7C5_VITVI|nr:Retrovirus-related Pol polyprotein from transposon 17.6 [Vitis vinifera]